MRSVLIGLALVALGVGVVLAVYKATNSGNGFAHQGTEGFRIEAPRTRVDGSDGGVSIQAPGVDIDVERR